MAFFLLTLITILVYYDMQIEGARAVLANTSKDMSLVWNSNLRLWGLVLGYHVEYIHPDDLEQMDGPAFLSAIHHKMSRYIHSLNNESDKFYKN